MTLYLGMFLISLSGLMFEIGLTRIFSATIWYHATFLAISVALLGWGLGGFCPGPALANLSALRIEALLFVPTMAIGMFLAQRFFGADR